MTAIEPCRLIGELPMTRECRESRQLVFSSLGQGRQEVFCVGMVGMDVVDIGAKVLFASENRRGTMRRTKVTVFGEHNGREVVAVAYGHAGRRFFAVGAPAVTRISSPPEPLRRCSDAASWTWPDR